MLTVDCGSGSKEVWCWYDAIMDLFRRYCEFMRTSWYYRFMKPLRYYALVGIVCIGKHYWYPLIETSFGGILACYAKENVGVD